VEDRRWSSRTGDLAIAGLLYLVATVGFASWYSPQYFDRARFGAQYDHGIYRYRVVGRDLVLLADRWLHGNPIGRWLGSPATQGQLFSAFFVVNGLAFLAFALFLRALLRRHGGLTESGRLCAYLVVLGAVALSSFVVTPYDMTSYALIAAFLLLVTARPPLDLLSIPVLVLAVLTRESAFVALAAVAAALLTGSPHVRLGEGAIAAASVRRGRRVFAVAAAAGVAAYLLLRVVAAGEPGSSWAALTLRDNVTSGRGLVGAAMAALAVACWRRVRPACGLAVGAGAITRRRWFLALSLPYLAVSVATGLWFELRLLVPVLLGDLWLALVGLQPGVLPGEQRHEEALRREVREVRRHPVRRAGDGNGAALRQRVDAGLGHRFGALPHELGEGGFGVLLGEAGGFAEAGVDRTGAQGCDGHALAAELAGQAPRVRQHERLAGGVAGLAGQRLEGGGGGDVEDRSLSSLDHAREEAAAEVGDGDDVDLDHVHLGVWV
jgi:hypothetical protein